MRSAGVHVRGEGLGGVGGTYSFVAKCVVRSRNGIVLVLESAPAAGPGLEGVPG